jgi:ribosome maturation factor RimP
VLLKLYEVGVGAHFFHDDSVTVGVKIMETRGLEGLIEPEVERLGFECIKTEIVGGSRNPIVRLYIDKPGGVSIKDCTLVSRAVGLILDNADPFPGRYLLEVSSPGNDRPLAKASHFVRFQNHTVKVQYKDGADGKKSRTGTIISCRDNILVLETESGMLEIKLNDIIKANLIGVEYKIDKKIKHGEKSRGGK